MQAARQPRAAERTVRAPGLPIELAFVFRLHQPLRRHQRHGEADGERAAAEAEGVDVIACLVVAAGVLVDVEDVPLQAVAEHAAQHGQRLERRRADAVVVVGDLLAAIGRRRPEVHRFVHAPDVRLEQLGAAVAGAVREQHDCLAGPCRAARGLHGGAHDRRNVEAAGTVRLERSRDKRGVERGEGAHGGIGRGARPEGDITSPFSEPPLVPEGSTRRAGPARMIPSI